VICTHDVPPQDCPCCSRPERGSCTWCVQWRVKKAEQDARVAAYWRDAEQRWPLPCPAYAAWTVGPGEHRLGYDGTCACGSRPPRVLEMIDGAT
jgi:hypothetical protein